MAHFIWQRELYRTGVMEDVNRVSEAERARLGSDQSRNRGRQSLAFLAGDREYIAPRALDFIAPAVGAGRGPAPGF